jgi:hypothetical protein
MAVTFMAPPGWPMARPGVLPPTNWQPAATLPPVPVGWVFYRGSAGEPASPPPGAWVPPAFAVPPATVSAASWASAPPAGYPSAAPVPPQPLASQAWQAQTQFPGVPLPGAVPGPMGFGIPGQVPTKKKRTGLIVGLSLGGVLVVAVAGVLAFVLLTAEPQLTPTQFAKVSSTTKIAGTSVELTSQKTNWSWSDGSQLAKVSECDVVPVFESAHVVAGYGDPDANAALTLFDSAANQRTAAKNWQTCEKAAIAAGVDLGSSETGATDGVVWEKFSSYSFFYYGNVMATLPSAQGSSAQTQAKEFKKLIDSLR